MPAKPTQTDVLKARYELDMAEESAKLKREAFDKIKAFCNCTNADGSSALEGGLFCKWCSVCGWSDM